MIEVFFNKGGVANNKKSLSFQNESIVLDTPINAGDTNVPLVWKYTGSPLDIVYVRPHCGCTAGVSFVGNTIIAYYNDTSVANTTTQHIKKQLSVYLDDGKELKIKQGLNSVFNDNKAKIIIEFTVKINPLPKPPYNKKDY